LLSVKGGYGPLYVSGARCNGSSIAINLRGLV
jgi:hypothetical protein